MHSLEILDREIVIVEIFQTSYNLVMLVIKAFIIFCYAVN
jgi:hypothetical protein